MSLKILLLTEFMWFFQRLRVGWRTRRSHRASFCWCGRSAHWTKSPLLYYAQTSGTGRRFGRVHHSKRNRRNLRGIKLPFLCINTGFRRFLYARILFSAFRFRPYGFSWLEVDIRDWNSGDPDRISIAWNFRFRDLGLGFIFGLWIRDRD